MSDSTPRPLLDRRDTTVDGLRGVAVMLVVLRHVLRSDVFGHHWYHRIDLGSMGVQLFFVISGFVIGALLTNQPSDLRGLGRFIARRLVRLSPPYYAAVALALVSFYALAQIDPTRSHLGVRSDLLACSIGYVCQPFGLPLYLDVAWSLEIEVQFYLLACCLVPLARAVGRGGAWLVAAAVLALSPFAPFYTVVHHAPPFAIGMAIVAHRRAAIGWPVFAALSVAIAAGWAVVLGEPETGATVALGALAIAAGTRMPAWLVWIGGISYSLYLVHPLLAPRFVSGVKQLGMPTLDWGWQILWSGIAIALSIAAAWLLHRFVEVPAVRWSHAIGLRRS